MRLDPNLTTALFKSFTYLLTYTSELDKVKVKRKQVVASSD